jgi:hypothetical protein
MIQNQVNLPKLLKPSREQEDFLDKKSWPCRPANSTLHQHGVKPAATLLTFSTTCRMWEMSFLPFISDCASNNHPAGSLQSLRQSSILAKIVYVRLMEWLCGKRRLEVLCISAIVSFQATVMSRSVKRKRHENQIEPMLSSAR